MTDPNASNPDPSSPGINTGNNSGSGNSIARDRPGPPTLAGELSEAETVLSVQHLSTSFFTRDGEIKAVRDVNFDIRKGEVVGLVGESGSGKTITARSLIGLVPSPGRIVGGQVIFKDRDLVSLPDKEMRKIRGAEMSMVLQEPMTSLNPLLTIGNQVSELYSAHPERVSAGTSIKEAVVDILRAVRIPEAERRQRDYPMHFSGGMRQRVSIAMAAALSPDLIIADEPTTALDVTIQAQVLDLLLELRSRLGTGILFITHDMGVVAQICDSVAVMYAGEIVEYTDVHTLFESPQHPYTKALLRSLPTLEERRDRLPSIGGHPPDLLTLGKGCPFAPRCDSAFDRCRAESPPLYRIGSVSQPSGHSRCWLHADAGRNPDSTAVSS